MTAVEMLLGVWAVCAVASPQSSDAYAEALHAYQSGDRDAAVRAAARIPDDELRRGTGVILQEVKRRVNVNRAEAAAMLHTEVFFLSADSASTDLPHPHLTIAKRMVDAVCGARGEPCDFARDWYLLLTAYFQRRHDLASADVYVSDARDRFPDDADVLLASGSVHEQKSRLGAGYLPAPGNRVSREWMDPDRERRRASTYYLRSLLLAPGNVEARLRLGRVMHELRDLPAAERELDAAARETIDPVFKYLALVFLASVREDLARKGDAFTLYAQAARLRPDGQVVYIGLAEIYVADGQPDEALKMADRLFATAAPLDPWWSYLQGQSWRLEFRLEELRARVRR